MKQLIKPTSLSGGYIFEQAATFGTGSGEDDVTVLNAFDELCFVPGVRLIVCSSQTVKNGQISIGKSAERRSKVADDVVKLRIVSTFILKDFVLHIEQVIVGH